MKQKKIQVLTWNLNEEQREAVLEYARLQSSASTMIEEGEE